ncbi:MAG: hypothetical protein ACLQOO_35725 [Terriglobia bacterium]
MLQSAMVAIQFKTAKERADGFMLLVRQGKVRTLRGEVFVCHESSLAALDGQKIPYDEIPLPVSSHEINIL